MTYDEMINGLADEMLEKIASEEDDVEYEDYEEGFEDGYGYEDEEGYTDEELAQMDDDELEALASAIYEQELEKTAGCGNAVKAAGKKAKGFGKALMGKDMYKERKILKTEGLGTQYAGIHKDMAKAEARKTYAARAAAGAGVAGAGAAGYGVKKLKGKGQEKAAALYEEAQLYKQAAEETWQEAQMIQDAASLVFDYFED